jgi:hypothetical protein
MIMVFYGFGCEYIDLRVKSIGIDAFVDRPALGNNIDSCRWAKRPAATVPLPILPIELNPLPIGSSMRLSSACWPPTRQEAVAKSNSNSDIQLPLNSTECNRLRLHSLYGIFIHAARLCHRAVCFD